MEKKFDLWVNSNLTLKKLIMELKIAFLIIVVSVSNVLAIPTYSQVAKISLNIKDRSLEQVMDEIENQSEFYFIFNQKQIDITRVVDIQAENKLIIDILPELFKGTDVNYAVFNRKILLTTDPLDKNLFAIASGTESQQNRITGTVTGKDGTPLPGVNVMVTATTQGTMTDLFGKYSIEVPQGSKSLTFSFIGMSPQEVTIGNQTVLNVIMQDFVVGLDEVVVVGYGTMKKKDLTGSLTQVNIKDEFIQLPNVSIVQTLQGSISGLNVGMVETAGQNPSLSIRGLNTLSTSAFDDAPLIVIDGATYRGSLIDLNPNDIESINILKDISSAAIYGSQASNGVILITSKKSSVTEKPIITYSNQFSLQVPSHKLVPMSGKELDQFIRDCLWEQGSRIGPDYLQPNIDFDFSALYLNTVEVKEGYEIGREIDWFGMFTGNGYTVNHNLEIKGKNKGFGYFMSGGFTDTKGFIKNDKYKRYNFRINLDSKINDWLSIGIESFLTSSDYSGVSPNIKTVFMTQPWAPIYDSKGDYMKQPNGWAENPFLTIQQDDEDKQFNVFGNMHADIKLPFIDGFNYRVNYFQNYITSINNRFNPDGANYTGYGYKNSSNYYMWSLENIVTYIRTFRDIHTFNLTLVYGIDKLKNSDTEASAQDFFNKDLGFNSLEAGNPSLFSLSSGASQETSLYSMGRLFYDFRNKYLITGTIRRDGFSGFGSENKIGLFPSIALAWVVSKENFFNLEWFNYLKLRAAYGSAGRRGVTRYDTKAIVSSKPATIFGDGGSVTMGQWMSKMANDKLSWETTTGLNIGADFNFMNSRLSGNFEYYSNNTKNILYQIQLPEATGFSSVVSNIGKVHNNGIELTLTGNIINAQNLNWEASFNFSRNRNKIVSILGKDKNGKEQDLVANLLFTGQPQNVIYDYEIYGKGLMWQLSDEQAGNIPEGFAAGLYKIIDQDNDGVITASDKKILGYIDPSYRFGIANTLRYKNFTLYFFINSIQGGKNYYKSYAGPPEEWNCWQWIPMFNGPKGAFDYWMPENPNAKYRRLDSDVGVFGMPEGRIFDQRNFVRLQDVTFSYTFNKDLIHKLSINNLRVFASGKNLITLTKWEGWDPETDRGLNYGLPVMTNFTIGLNVEF